MSDSMTCHLSVTQLLRMIWIRVLDVRMINKR